MNQGNIRANQGILGTYTSFFNQARERWDCTVLSCKDEKKKHAKSISLGNIHTRINQSCSKGSYISDFFGTLNGKHAKVERLLFRPTNSLFALTIPEAGLMVDESQTCWSRAPCCLDPRWNCEPTRSRGWTIHARAFWVVLLDPLLWSQGMSLHRKQAVMRTWLVLLLCLFMLLW